MPPTDAVQRRAERNRRRVERGLAKRRRANTIAAVADAMRRGNACPTCGETGIPHKGVLQCDARSCPDVGLVIRELRAGEGDDA